jgi:hypothetical protein
MMKDGTRASLYVAIGNLILPLGRNVFLLESHFTAALLYDVRAAEHKRMGLTLAESESGPHLNKKPNPVASRYEIGGLGTVAGRGSMASGAKSVTRNRKGKTTP